MSQPVSAVVKDGDASHTLRFDACRVWMGGEFAGNIELDIACDAAAVAPLLDGLRVQVPGAPPSDMALGNGEYAPGVQLVFWIEPSDRPAELLEEVTLLWGETPIARIAPSVEDTVPIEQVVAFTEPSEILKTFPVAISSHVLLAANREKWWIVLAALLLVGGALVAAAFPGLELPSRMLNWALGGSMIVAGAWVGLFLGRVPYRQVWLDRDRRRVVVIAGRSGSPKAKLAEAPGRSLDGFDHVRLYQRWSIAEHIEQHDQEVWSVTLEGRIPFASADGTVNLRADALPLGEFGSEIPARRLAAEVGFHTGLKILDTGHDKTA